MSGEKDNFNLEGKEFNDKALEAARQEHQERLDESRRERAEAQQERSVEQARAEVEQAAHEKEKTHENTVETARSQEKKERRVTKRDKDNSYKTIMVDAERHMTPAGRSFSRFIHNPVIEKTSEVVGGSIAKPNAILAGSVFAFLFTLAIYAVARMYGYPLSGAETIASFAVGWLFGQLFDYFRVMITGKR